MMLALIIDIIKIRIWSSSSLLNSVHFIMYRTWYDKTIITLNYQNYLSFLTKCIPWSLIIRDDLSIGLPSNRKLSMKISDIETISGDLKLQRIAGDQRARMHRKKRNDSGISRRALSRNFADPWNFTSQGCGRYPNSRGLIRGESIRLFRGRNGFYRRVYGSAWL